MGHGRTEIAEAVGRQAAQLDYSPAFQFGHPLSFELANRIVSFMPEGLNRVFFTCSGSESVDSAMKMALAYHRIRGQGHRQLFVSRERAYHGVNLGGVAFSRGDFAAEPRAAPAGRDLVPRLQRGHMVRGARSRHLRDRCRCRRRLRRRCGG